VVANLVPAALGREHRRHRLPLDVGVLDPDHATWPEQVGGADRDRADRVETVGTGEER
jgi:hypothetical protein